MFEVSIGYTNFYLTRYIESFSTSYCCGVKEKALRLLIACLKLRAN